SEARQGASGAGERRRVRELFEVRAVLDVIEDTFGQVGWRRLAPGRLEQVLQRPRVLGGIRISGGPFAHVVSLRIAERCATAASTASRARRRREATVPSGIPSAAEASERVICSSSTRTNTARSESESERSA